MNHIAATFSTALIKCNGEICNAGAIGCLVYSKEVEQAYVDEIILVRPAQLEYDDNNEQLNEQVLLNSPKMGEDESVFDECTSSPLIFSKVLHPIKLFSRSIVTYFKKNDLKKHAPTKNIIYLHNFL